jgi:hypothetical protein
MVQFSKIDGHLERRTVMFMKQTAAMLRVMIISALWAAPLHAADYYVAPNGNDANSGAKDKPWRTIAKANRMLSAGDTVYIFPGEYREQINPANSGQSEQYITYSSYAEQHPVLTASPGRMAIMLNNKSYVRISGIDVDGKDEYTKSNLDTWVQIRGGNHNIIENGTFKNAKGWYGFLMLGTNYNEILNNHMDTVGTYCDRSKGGDCMVGDMLALQCADHNLIQDNYFTRGGHNLMHVSGNNNVIRSNTFENKWSDTTGYRALELTANQRFCERAVGYNVFEQNIVKNSLQPPTSKGEVAMKVEGTGQIVRNNLFYNNDGWATTSAIRPPIIPRSEHNRVYNNTLVKNEGLWFSKDYGDGQAIDNIYKNNLVIASRGQEIIGGGRAGNVFAHNALTERPSGVSKSSNNLIGIAASFRSEDTTSYKGFRLNQNSPMIDSGDYLTKTARAGSGKTVPIIDAGWFTDGFGITVGDLVTIGDSAPVRILEVDYSANTLGVESSVSWTAGANVSLPYRGAAPDIGAYEYVNDSAKDPNAPSSLSRTKQ